MFWMAISVGRKPSSIYGRRISVVVPPDADPPADDPRLPHCLWTLVGGRVIKRDAQARRRDSGLFDASRHGRRRCDCGLASRLLLAVMAAARNDGTGSATLQASPSGLSVYERLGFRRVATLRGYLRPNAGK